ncbi:hypothetical protein [Geodermatophilus ruber]|uniref:Uncharacterized protein n=1 Tax=Geodermatophilus ruber TaxID=504800 RepID=A0A1I4GTG2_9ACTN|nr:hypothetical protein [Geodermatophilus ruber]SFL32647.1 hypothetical protein SAMN04488085_109148 [Geodermatophilus ruber]
MQERTPAGSPLAHTLANTALIVVVLGVLPLAWDAATVWKVLGPVVAVLFAGRAVAQVRRQVFSTSPRQVGV